VITRLLYALFVFAIVGQNQPASAASTGAVNHAGPEIRARLLSDAEIERTMKAKLAKSKLAADHFTFSVVKGVATIEGKTAVMQNKGVMTRMAKTSGATAVRNNIVISDAAKAKAVAGLAKIRTNSPMPRPAVVGTQAGGIAANGTPASGVPTKDTSAGNAPTAESAIPRASVLPAGTKR